MGAGVSSMSQAQIAELATSTGLSEETKRIAESKVSGVKLAEWRKDDDLAIIEQLEDIGITSRHDRRAVLAAIKREAGGKTSASGPTPEQRARFLRAAQGVTPWVLGVTELQGWLKSDSELPDALARALAGADGPALFTTCGLQTSKLPLINSDMSGKELKQHEGVTHAHVKKLQTKLTTNHGLGYIFRLWRACGEDDTAYKVMSQYAWQERLGEGAFGEVRRERRRPCYSRLA